MVRKLSIIKFGDVPVYGKFIDGFGWIEGQMENIIKKLKKNTDEEILNGNTWADRRPYIKMNSNCWASAVTEDVANYRRYNACRILPSNEEKVTMSSTITFDNNRIVIFIGM